MVDLADVDMCIKPLKEELAWDADKWLWIISTIMLFKKPIAIHSTMELKGTQEQSCFKFKIILFALLCSLSITF